MSIKKLQEKREEGFTLIELLIVIVILGILAAIVVFSVGGITDRGSRSACQANVESVNIAAEAFRTQSPTGAYPATLNNLTTNNPPASRQFLKTIPGTLAADGLSFVVAPGGGTSYTIVYTPGTGTAAATGGCPTGN